MISAYQYYVKKQNTSLSLENSGILGRIQKWVYYLYYFLRKRFWKTSLKNMNEDYSDFD